jgi:hypothetical protein
MEYAITICHEGAGTEEIVSEAFQITLGVLTLPVMVNFGLPPVETLLPGPENAPDNCNLITDRPGPYGQNGRWISVGRGGFT